MEEPKILYEDKDILVVDKPAGMLVHGIYHKGLARHTEETLSDWVVTRYPEVAKVGDDPEKRAGLVHRLDRDTSGVMIVARTQDAFHYFKNLFQTGGITKTYLALVWGKLEENSGRVDKPISIINGSVKRTVGKGKMMRTAITDYAVVKRLTSSANEKGEINEFTLLKISPKTGRTHQIRVHMASIGHPVVGDHIYTRRKTLPGLTRQFLHADTIEFSLSNGKRLAVGAPLPEELESTLAALHQIIGSERG